MKRRIGVLDSLLALIPVFCENCGIFKAPVGVEMGEGIIPASHMLTISLVIMVVFATQFSFSTDTPTLF